MITACGPLFGNPRRRALTFWGALACLNLAAGIVISSASERLADLETIRDWGADWLVGRANIYSATSLYVDYPPNAIVLLSPLSVLPIGIAGPLWVLLNISMACLAAFLTARFFRPEDPFKVIVLPILMFLCWGGVRTLTQFSLLALTFSMAAMVLADRRPLAAGAWLGLAMMKPQVALPVFFWSTFTRRWRLTATSLVVVGGLFSVFCAWAQADPWSVLARYASILAMYHTGDAILAGLSEMRPLIRQFVTNFSDVDAIAGCIGFGLLAAICMAGFREGSARRRGLYTAPPLIACWSLLTFYHLTYGFVVLLPVMMFLALSNDEPSRLRKSLFWLLQLGMMFDVPGLSRRLGLGGTVLYANVLAHADRALMVLVFIGLVGLASRSREEVDRQTAQ